MFLASNICCVSSGTVTARYCWLPRAVNGAKSVMKKWRRGNGTNRALVLSFHDLGRQLTQVDGKLAQVRVELTREAQASGDTGHDEGDEVVQVTVRRRGELESAGEHGHGRFAESEGVVVGAKKVGRSEGCRCERLLVDD
jgi:hypothetical protein